MTPRTFKTRMRAGGLYLVTETPGQKGGRSASTLRGRIRELECRIHELEHGPAGERYATLKAETEKAESDLAELSQTSRALHRAIEIMRDEVRSNMYGSADMPTVPVPLIRVDRKQCGSPTAKGSGIYFAWEIEHGRVAYVGQSIDLYRRLKGNHPQVRDGDWISWLLFPPEQLNSAECYYIWLCRPCRNFGGRVGAMLEVA